jgi:PTS system nitrogen regulatory IIA component
MAAEDFDIASLAAYLHLNPDQVQKMAERGKLPGRRLGGGWKFSEAEIHHWLEERIGVSDEGELIGYETVLDKGRTFEPPLEQPVSVTQLLPLAAMAVPLKARTRTGVVDDMVELAASTGWLWDPPKMAEAVRLRESLHPTAIDSGVALMHPRRPLSNIVAEPFLAMGITPSGVPFGAERGGLTNIFFLILATTDREHLRMLARLSRIIADANFLALLRSAEGVQEAHELIEKREQELE